MSTTDRRIYVACLASYNNGVLHGTWIDVAYLDEDDLYKEVRDKVLLTSRFPNVMVPCPDCEGSGKDVDANTNEVVNCARCQGKGELPSAEEWAIHDHEGYPSGLIGEYTPLSEIARIEEILEDLSSDDEMEAFMIWVNEMQSGDFKDVTVEQFRDKYRGKYDSHADFAMEWAVETGMIADDHPFFSYIDWNHYWEGDLRHNGFSESGGHYFWD
jgi:antirestriction protein